ncbi:serine/threonine-protein kinase [Humisphaera borealis]|uniref:Serine/threonine protein kinase n=1 Tax=Humisphaera borealis TaxID=2807512 RepID=A0A7M2WXG0_9BACT|nr:serine/threonine-protein kinase [Humisphaera borealis]QOV90099.1 serine/threonine protein kinase [Humisphaera borealis]
MTDELSEPERHPVDLIAEEFAARYRRGERPAISEYTDRHPELTEQIRNALQSVAMMERMNVARRSQSGLAITPTLERVGDFRIVRELGRGGMGVVFEAVQESLGRRVAIKILSASAVLDPTRLARFEQEARAAARLHHTNIVPIFGVGQQGDIHYYVMQCIDGQGLGQVTRSLASAASATRDRGRARKSSGPKPGHPAEPQTPAVQSLSQRTPTEHYKWVADIGAQVADALQYAHDRGVLHRDVKPANLILDDAGIVWVADFGLAKVGNDSNVTRTGDIIGTLQYMAPEAIDKKVDARSDIYGLGLTLYELLTLQPPYRDTGPAELIRLISTASPASPRSINPAIPRDLETIVLKAIAREPSHRYPTAVAMERDLRAFIAGRSISARRVSPWERAWRWSRRNRAVAALLVATTLSILTALVVGWIGYKQTSVALKAESIRRGEAETARKISDDNVRLCLDALSDLFGQLSASQQLELPMGGGPPGERREPPLDRREPPGGRPDHLPAKDMRALVNAGVLEGVLRFYDRFSERNLTDPSLEVEAAWGYHRVADVYRLMSETESADRSYGLAAERFERALAGPSSDDALRASATAGLLESIGSISAIPGDPEGRAVALKQIAYAMNQYVEREGVDQRAGMPMAACHYRTGRLLEASNDAAGALAAYNASMMLLERRGEVGPPRGPNGDGGRAGPPVVTLGDPASRAAAVLLAQGRTDEARALLVRVINQIERAESESRGPPRHRESPAILYELLVEVETKLGDTAAADKARRQAARLRERNDRPPGDRPPDGRPREAGPRGGPPPFR